MQNLVQFYTTCYFDRGYLQNETIYPKLERYVIETDSSHVQRNKSGELWSTVLYTCEFGPAQIDFFGRLYFGP